MTPVTAQDAAAMDDLAAWGSANVVHLPAMSPEQAKRAERLAAAAHTAAHVRGDVGHYTQGLEYVPAYLAPIRQYVTVGFAYEPAEPGDAEQPEIGEYFEVQEVWLRGVDIGVLVDDEDTDKLIDAIKAGRAMEGGDL
jgi:hypothetical protein